MSNYKQKDLPGREGQFANQGVGGDSASITGNLAEFNIRDGIPLTPAAAPQPATPSAPPTDPANGSQRAAPQAPGALPPTLEALRHVPCWLLWHLDLTMTLANGKHPKVPHYATSHAKRAEGFLTPADLAQLVTYDAAIAAASDRYGFYSGVGIVSGVEVAPGWFVQGLDFDNMPADKVQSAPAAMLGYVEVTPSGAGLRAIGVGRKFNTLTSQGTNLEAYANGQFLTVTLRMCKDDGPTDFYEWVVEDLTPLHARIKAALQAAESGAGSVTGSLGIVQVDPQTVTELRSALFHICADDYDTWQRMGSALRCLGPTGLELWLTWSATSTKFDPKVAMEKWNKLGGERSSYQAVFAEAQSRGWVNPNSNEARGIGGKATTGSLGGEGRVLQEQTMDSIVAQAIDWVWPGWIAKRYINIFAGETGAGKSTVLADIVARITTGKPWPSDNEVDQELRHPAGVLWLGSEDGLEDMTKPRMMAAGADNSRIVVIKGVEVNGKRGTFSMQDDIETVRARLRKAIEEGRPFAMLVIDPITSYLNGSVLRKVDMNDSGQIRSILEPWMAVAQEFDIALCAVTHFTKDTTRSMLNRVLGSGAFAATCRSLVAVVKPPENEDGEMLFGIHAKVMLQTKTNLPDPPSGAWIFETERVEVGTDARNGKAIAATRAVWQEVNEMITPASYLGAKRGPVSKKAIPFGIWLQTLFFTVPLGEWLPVEEVKNKALAAGVTTPSWWKDHSAEYMEKANQNGIWMCKIRT